MKLNTAIRAGLLLALSGSVLAQAPAPAPGGAPAGPPPDTSMSFFVTSVGLGDGANLGGLAGADAHCKALAEAAGTTGKTWHAYLSTQGEGAVNAIDRIGKGPWANAKGVIMATNIESLKYDNSNFNYEHMLDENGNHFASRIDGTPDTTEHDALTGTRIDGTAFPPGEDRTCSNWTSSAEGKGAAWVGHADRYSFQVPGSPWNSSHATPGCSPQNLISVGGAGLLYCFAVE